MSTSGQRRTRGPAHQNTFAFRHNPKSKKTEKILAMPNEGLCQRCHDKVEWRKRYRKYKPLTAPARCNICQQKTVRAAYHTVCQPCAQARKACAWCLESKAIVSSKSAEEAAVELEAKREELERDIKGLHLRKQRKILRAFDQSHGKMDVAAAVARAEAEEGEGDDDDWGSDEEDEDWSDEDGDEDEGEGGGK